MDLVNGIDSGQLDTDAVDRTQQLEMPEALLAAPINEPRSRAVVSLEDGTLLSARYRVLHRIAGGWLAFDERLSRPVFVAALVTDGELPAERVRREVARGVPLVDAIIAGDAVFAVRAMSAVD